LAEAIWALYKISEKYFVYHLLILICIIDRCGKCKLKKCCKLDIENELYASSIVY